MPPGLTAAIASGNILETIVMKGSQRDLRSALIASILKSQASAGISKTQIRNAANLELAYLRKQGVPLDGTTEVRILVKRDPKATAGALKGLTRSRQNEAMANTFELQPGAAECTLPAVDPVNPGGLGKAAGPVSSAPMLVGILGTLLQFAAYCKTKEELDKALNCDKAELQTRKWSQLGGMVGSSMQALGEAGKRISATLLEEESLASLAFLKLIRAGTIVGAAGGLLSAGMDAKMAWDTVKAGEYGLCACYFLSAAGSTLLSLLPFVTVLSTIPWLGWALAITVLLAGLLISYLSRDKIEKWLDQCCWAPGKHWERFNTMAMEQQQLALALGH